MESISIVLVFPLDVMNPLPINHILDKLCTDRLTVIDDFLLEGEYQALLQFMHQLSNQNNFREAQIGSRQSSNRNSSIRSDKIFWLDNILQQQSALHPYVKAIEKIMEICNKNLFSNIKTWEGHFAIYQPGSFYKKHVDQFKTNKDRQISCIYYLNDDWEIENGGELLVYNESNELLSNILPKGNRFVCFRSELPHEVLPCFLRNRYSLTAWLKSPSIMPQIF